MNLKTKKTNEEEYYAFFDAEYTCFMRGDHDFDRRHNNEVIAVGLVITTKQFKVKKTYYSPIRPKYNPILTGYCKSLTGLKQSEIDKAPDYETVFQKMSKLFEKYPVREIFVWGSDHRTLEDDIAKNHTNVAKNHKKIVHKVTDITKRLTIRLFDKPLVLGLADMKYICNQNRSVAHNALEDAKDLYYVTKCIVEKNYNAERAEALLQYVEDRELYHRYRRFKQTYLEENADFCQLDPSNAKGFQHRTEIYIAELKKYYTDAGKFDPAIAALCDDLRILALEEAKDIPQIKS